MDSQQHVTSGFTRAVLLALGVGVFLPVGGNVASMTLAPGWHWDHVPFHAAIEVTGGLFALGVAGILLAARRPGVNQHHLWMGAALVGMGILDIAHAVVAPGNSFVWFHSTATLVGGLLFAMVWVPARIALARGIQVLLLTGAVAVALCAWSLCFPSTLPAMVQQGAFTPAAWGLNIVGGIGFLVAAGWFLKRYRTTRAWDDQLFACLCGLFGAAGVLFELSSLWDAAWWWWHSLRLGAYGLAITYSAVVYQRTRGQLLREIAERQQVEDELAEALERQGELNRLQDALLGPGELAEKLSKITDGIVKIFDADFCRIWITTPGDRCESGCIHADVTEGPHVCRYRDRCLHLMASSGRYTHTDGEVHQRVPFGCYKIGRVAADQEHKFLTNEAATDPRVHDHEWVKELGLVSFVGYQLRPPGGQTTGVLALFSKHIISPEDDTLLESLANTTAQVIQTARAEATAAARTAELEQRTIELEKSRRMAVSMMEKAERARWAAERAKDMLAKSDQAFIESFQASADATLLIDGEMFVDCNDRTVEMLRASSKEQVLATHPSELSPEIQPDGRSSYDKANEMIATAIERGSNRFEWAHRRLDGEEFPVEVTLMPISLFGKQMLYCVWKDISELIAARAAADLAEEELRKLSVAVEQSPATVVITNPQGVIEYVNPRFIETTGYTAEEAIGQNPRILKSNDKSSADYHEMWATILAGNIWRGEFRNKKKNGELYWEAASISPLLDADGVITHFLAVKEDITERKQAEEELRASNAMMVDALEREKRAAMKLEATMAQLAEAKEAAEAATRSKSEFLANMSHEIRTPMTAILGYTDVLIGETWGRSSQGTLQVIKRNGEHLLRLINDILDISKIEAGKLFVERVRCSPVQLVADIQSLMQVRADAKNLPFKAEYVGAVPETIESDPLRLKQILVNLIGNAIKFTETGGVRLVTRLVEESGIHGLEDSSYAGEHPSDSGTAGPFLQFDIIDSGIGMTEEQMGRLFEAFSQADMSTTRKYGGTGLGLMISKRLAEMLGGTITVESNPGVGSTFRVTVATGSLEGVKMLDNPSSAVLKQLKTGTAPELQVDIKDCRILLAEDGPDNQLLISHVLKKAGADVTVVENGKLAVDAALAARDENVPFDVILMDMQMPVMDGYEATSVLRRRDYDGPIIALTAHAMDGDRQKCMDAGCDDYASKPINRKKLIGAIKKLARQGVGVGGSIT